MVLVDFIFNEIAKQLVESISIDVASYMNEYEAYKNECLSWYVKEGFNFNSEVHKDIVKANFSKGEIRLNLRNPDTLVDGEYDCCVYEIQMAELLHTIVHYESELSMILNSIDNYMEGLLNVG